MSIHVGQRCAPLVAHLRHLRVEWQPLVWIAVELSNVIGQLRLRALQLRNRLLAARQLGVERLHAPTQRARFARRTSKHLR